MKDLSKLRVAIVHDWLVGGGAELVVLELHRMFPDAPIYTSYCTAEWRQKLDNKVITGFLQHWPFSRLRKYMAILRIWWFTHLDFSGYDLVISSTGNGEAKGIKVPQGTLHVCYCHTPTHFYWRHREQYLKNPGFGPFASLGLRLLTGPLRRWDLKASGRPDYYIANSNHIKDDIKLFYGRDAVVIHPPVDIERFETKKVTTKRHGFISVGRQVPYKRVDLIVQACTELNASLLVIGNGPDHAKLVKQAGPTIKFLERLPSEEVAKRMSKAQAFIIAALEDFGITPVEAIAAGTPVIAYKAGGALDYVIAHKTGEFFEPQTVEALKKVLKNFAPSQYTATQVAQYAKKFDRKVFRERMTDFLTSLD